MDMSRSPCLQDLPNELILKIYHDLTHDSNGINLSHENRTDYLSLAFTCKRFLYLTENQYNRILDREQISTQKGYPELVHSCFIDNKSTSESSPPEIYGLCPVHGQDSAISTDCLYGWLCPVLSFKYINYTQIQIRFRDIREPARCVLALESSRFDKIVSLDITWCHIDSQTLGGLLASIKNMKQLKVYNNEHHDNNDAPVPLVERALDYIYLNACSARRHQHPLLHPNIRLATKILCLEFRMPSRRRRRNFHDIIERFKDCTQLFRISASKYSIRNELETLKSSGIKFELDLELEHFYGSSDSE